MHTDPELLGLLALGEHVGTEGDRAHAHTCPQCADELSQLVRVTTLGRSADVKSPLTMPSPQVWARILRELDFLITVDPSAAPPVTEIDGEDAERPPLDLVEPLPPGEPLTLVEPLPGPSRDPGDQLTARAQLTPVAASWSQASGTADLATDDTGRRLLQVSLHADLPTSGVRQAWLVHRDDPSRRQTLGILDGSWGLWTVDHSIDLAEFAILDISQQGVGETEHSGQTIVRGELALAS